MRGINHNVLEQHTSDPMKAIGMQMVIQTASGAINGDSGKMEFIKSDGLDEIVRFFGLKISPGKIRDWVKNNRKDLHLIAELNNQAELMVWGAANNKFDEGYLEMLEHVLARLDEGVNGQEILKECREKVTRPEPTEEILGAEEAVNFFEEKLNEFNEKPKEEVTCLLK